MPKRNISPKSDKGHENASFKELVANICNCSFNIVTIINFIVMTIYYLIFVTSAGYILKTYFTTLSVAGSTSGIMVIGCLAGRFISGNLLSLTGCKPLLAVGLILHAISIALFFLIHSLPLVFADRLLTGIAVGIVGTTTATIAAYVIPAQHKAFGISLFSMGTALALALGPFIGLVLLRYVEYSTLILIVLMAAICAAALCLPLKNPPAMLQKRRPIFQLISYIDPRVVRFAITPLIVFMGYGCIQAFMATFAAERGLSGIASLFFLIYGAVALASRPFTGRLMDASGENSILCPLFVIIAIGLLALAYTSSGWLLLLAGALCGYGYGNFQSIGQAVSLSLVTPSRFAQATSTFFIFMDLGIGIGPYIFGILVSATGYSGMFVALAATSIAAIGLYYTLHGRYVFK